MDIGTKNDMRYRWEDYRSDLAYAKRVHAGGVTRGVYAFDKATWTYSVEIVPVTKAKNPLHPKKQLAREIGRVFNCSTAYSSGRDDYYDHKREAWNRAETIDFRQQVREFHSPTDLPPSLWNDS